MTGRGPVVAPREPAPRVELTPKPTVCEVCLTDTELGPCPADCPARPAED